MLRYMPQPNPTWERKRNAIMVPLLVGVARPKREPNRTMMNTAPVSCHCQCLILLPKVESKNAPKAMARPCGSVRTIA